MDTNVLIDKLFSVGAHFGYAPSRRHPSVARYIFATKGGIELFDLEKTALCIEQALTFVESLAKDHKTILFISGKAEAREAVRREAERFGAPYVVSRWIGGTLTNFPEIRKRLARLADLSDKREKGELAQFTKRERVLIDREITDLEVMFGGLRGMQKLPDALCVVDPKHEHIAVEEAMKMGIPVIAIMNSDCNANAVAYPIPANDSTLQSISYILSEITKTYLTTPENMPLPSEPTQ